MSPSDRSSSAAQKRSQQERTKLQALQHPQVLAHRCPSKIEHIVATRGNATNCPVGLHVTNCDQVRLHHNNPTSREWFCQSQESLSEALCCPHCQNCAEMCLLKLFPTKVPCTSAENCFLPGILAERRATHHFCLPVQPESAPTRQPWHGSSSRLS